MLSMFLPTNMQKRTCFLTLWLQKQCLNPSLTFTLIPLDVQHQEIFTKIVEELRYTRKLPKALFSWRLLLALQSLQLKNHRYQHMVLIITYIPQFFTASIILSFTKKLSWQETFLGEILGTVVLASDNSTLESEF